MWYAQNHNPNPTVTIETKYSAQSCVISHSLTWVLCKVEHYIDADSFKGGGVLWSNVPAFVTAEKVKMDEAVVANAVGLRVMK